MEYEERFYPAKAQRKVRVKDFDRITGFIIIGFNRNYNNGVIY